MQKVAAIVVTYNRKELLKECLNALLGQTVQLSNIILIDNASTDGTHEMLEQEGLLEKLQYIHMDKNTGGSGGFYRGLQEIKNNPGEFDWIWIMDDDTIPTPNCLEKLLEANEVIKENRKNIQSDYQKRPVSFLASSIYGPDNEFMNLPQVNDRNSNNGYAYWYELLKEGLINIRAATFVSILVSEKAVQKCGLPCRDYFIWGDDSEYTNRLTKFYGDAFLVGESIAIHKRKGAKALLIDNTDDPKRIKNYYYMYRNGMINGRFYGDIRHPLKAAVVNVIKGTKYIGRKNGWLKFTTIWKGYFDGLNQYKKFSGYIESQVSEEN